MNKHYAVYIHWNNKWYPMGKTIEGHVEPVNRLLLAFMFTDELSAKKAQKEFSELNPEYQFKVREIKK